MNTKRCERMHDMLFLIKEQTAERAYRIQNASDLREYAKEKSRQRTEVFFKSHPLYKAWIAVTCFALVIGIILSPSLFGAGTSVTPSPDSPIVVMPPSGDAFTIKSIDMVNYYSATRALENADTPALKSKTPLYPTPLSSRETADTVYKEKFSPTAVFTVSGATFFRIRIEDEHCFLASKVGTGTVDVVITENNFEPMITFKNGDRYFTCCKNSEYTDGRLYSTHKYVEGFYFVKNFGQKNYSFRVFYDNSTLDSPNTRALRIEVYEGITEKESTEAVFDVIGDTLKTDKQASFTIAELERYFNESAEPCAQTSAAGF